MTLKIKQEYTSNIFTDSTAFIMKLVRDAKWCNYAVVIKDGFNNKMARAGGCGYCKRSNTLKQLFSKILEDNTTEEAKKLLNEIDSGSIRFENLEQYGFKVTSFIKGVGVNEVIYFSLNNI